MAPNGAGAPRKRDEAAGPREMNAATADTMVISWHRRSPTVPVSCRLGLFFFDVVWAEATARQQSAATGFLERMAMSGKTRSYWAHV